MLSMIVLAAGKSTRMPGRNKLLVEIEGKSMIRRVVEACLGSKVDEIIVVVGWQSEKISAALTNINVRFVENRDYEKGQSSSVRAGLGAVSENAQAILILPGDVALIDPKSINLVIDEYAHNKAPIIVAAYKGNSGHPILLDRQLFTEIGRIDEPTFGLKAVVEKHRDSVKLVETGSQHVLRDIDTPEDLKEIPGQNRTTEL